MIILSILAGLSAGALHVLCGPDHLAAIAPLSADRGRKAASIGLRWGIGHSGGVIFVGLVALLLRGLFNIEAFAGVAEWLVGITLIGIGLWGLRRAYSGWIRNDVHDHGEIQHAHIHVANRNSSHRHSHAAFAIGTLHGLAGSSHFLGVLPALALPTVADALAFLIAYGGGTILAMTLFAAGLGRIASMSHRIEKPFVAACSTLAVVVGCRWLLL